MAVIGGGQLARMMAEPAAALGIPLRLTIGKRTISGGEVEAQVRRGRETKALPLEGTAAAAKELWATLP